MKKWPYKTNTQNNTKCNVNVISVKATLLVIIIFLNVTISSMIEKDSYSNIIILIQPY